jgi:phosphorylcholine metabolism protein LicD
MRQSKKRSADKKDSFAGKLLQKTAVAVTRAFNARGTGFVHYFVPDSRQFSHVVYADSIFEELFLADFEGYRFFAPARYDYILTMDYADYMTPPPPNMRLPHALAELEFN